MTERLAEVTARIDGIRQLGAVVNAMRGIAAARAQMARGQLAAVDGYAATIGTAIGQASRLTRSAGEGETQGSARPALIFFCAEQGFAGAFSERLLDATFGERVQAATGANLTDAAVFLIGTRGASIAEERGIACRWKGAMPSHSSGIPALAGRIAEALYPEIAAGRVDRLDAVFGLSRPGQGTGIERRRLFPLDATGFPPPADANPPLTNLAPEALLRELAADYLHALLCHAALHAFAAESEARMETMAAAHTQIERQLSVLRATQRQVRQEEITAEIVELAAGESAIRAL